MFVTGAPGVGKTTLIQRIHQHYKTEGLTVAGITTHEVREGDQRVGFRITDLSSGTEGWLAKVDDGTGPRIGRYTVVTGDLERVGVGGLREAMEASVDLVLVDEIGPMEMTSNAFRNMISKLLSQEAIVIATVKYGSHYPEVEGASETAETVKVEALRNNREEVFLKITSIVNSWIKR